MPQKRKGTRRGGWMNPNIAALGRKSKGRPKGSRDRYPRVNKQTMLHKEVAVLAREYTAEATLRIVAIMRQKKSEFAALAAAREILDRGWGKPAMSVTHQGDIHHTHEEAIKLIEARVVEAEEEERKLNGGNGSTH